MKCLKKQKEKLWAKANKFPSYKTKITNCVMATDTCDKDLIKARNQRWDLAFS